MALQESQQPVCTLHRKRKLFQRKYTQAERSVLLLHLYARATGAFETVAEIQQTTEFPMHTSASLGLCGR